MINFFYETDFSLEDERDYERWARNLVGAHGGELGELNYIFCDDEYLIRINREYLNHDTYTDIITFDYCSGYTVAGDIFISTPRIRENSYKFDVSFDVELRRVMAHGILHLLGFGDKTDSEIGIMREEEEKAIKMFHVEP